MYNRKYSALLVLLIGVLLITACRANTQEPTGSLPVGTDTSMPSEAISTASPSPVEPTDTPVSLAALVNGEPITVDEFHAELSQYLAVQDETGMNLATNAESFVLDDMINQILFAQAAYDSGYYLDDSGLQTRIDELAEKIGGTQVLTEWYSNHGYSEPEFRLALARSIASAWMQDQIIAEVPTTVEQVHARQILLYNEDQANEVYDLLQSGQDFEPLALNYDPVTGGDLGWFPRGYLTQSAVEDAAFSLAPGEYSQVIKTDIGYHIVQVIEKDPKHKLDPDAYARLQIQSLQEWLETHRSESEIQILLP